jgi:hypothetical protein
MRRIDVLGLGLGLLIAGGGVFLVMRLVGLDGITAGIWSQAIMVVVVIGWLLSYLFRVVTHNMTLNQQLDDYESAVLQKRLEELTPEELDAIQAKLDAEKASR